MASGGELWKRRYDNDRSAFDISVSPCLCVCLSCAFWWILARSDCQQTVSRSETNHCVHVSNEYFTSVTVSGVQHTRSVASTVGTRNNDTVQHIWTELSWPELATQLHQPLIGHARSPASTSHWPTSCWLAAECRHSNLTRTDRKLILQFGQN